jgi:hypothetical protein
VHNFNWKKLSAIGVLVGSPAGRSVRLRLGFTEGSVVSADVVDFLKALRREFPRPMILLWDRLPAHKSRQTQSYVQAATRQGWLRLEWLPPYAPELNPVEYLWGHLDGGVMAHYAPPTLGEIRQRVQAGARHIRRRPDALRGFLKASGLFLTPFVNVLYETQ